MYGGSLLSSGNTANMTATHIFSLPAVFITTDFASELWTA
jgi:hypothetical protein